LEGVRGVLKGTAQYCRLGRTFKNQQESGEQECQAAAFKAAAEYFVAMFSKDLDSEIRPFIPSFASSDGSHETKEKAQQ
jgi:hypothetical protein